MHNPKIRKARQIQGKNVILRNAEIGDAPFIFKIRTIPETKSLLSGAPNQLIDQENYLRKYQNDSDHAYFIVCDKNGVSKGTVRLHDPCNDQCAWGSWILHEIDNPAETLESALLLLHYAMELGFSRIVFHAKKKIVSSLTFTGTY